MISFSHRATLKIAQHEALSIELASVSSARVRCKTSGLII